MPRGITETDVWRACDALLIAGARPTIERVRQHLGRGSPNTVSPHLDTWFKGLGARISDPEAFAVASELPDPVFEAAKYLWEAASAEARRDLDQRLQHGLAEAVDNIEAEKQKTAQANASAFEAAALSARLRQELADASQALEQSNQNLAAERARLVEVRAAATEAHDRLRRQEQVAVAEKADLLRQLTAAVERADAADRRVALELDRERTLRAKADRQAEALLKGMESLRSQMTAAEDASRRLLADALERETVLHQQCSAAASALAQESAVSAELRMGLDTRTHEAAEANARASALQQSIDRLTSLLSEAHQEARRSVKTERTRTRQAK